MLACVVVAALQVGCGTDGCVEGKSEPCVCADGRTGAQVCRDDGTFGACSCAYGSFDAAAGTNDAVAGVPGADAGAGDKDAGGGKDGGGGGKDGGGIDVGSADAGIADSGGPGDAGADAGADAADVPAGPPEQCNGKDDDGDGAIDEWDGVHNPVCQVEVPAGPFLVGCTPKKDSNCEPDEKPYHSVTLSAFAIDRNEVTQRAWAACVKAGACSEPAKYYKPEKYGDRPVVMVDWKAADHYCKWRGMRLPTELEWEKAARGDDGRIWPWGDAPPTDCSLANLLGCGNNTRVVGAVANEAGKSQYGAFDMAGNAAEWTADWYDSSAWGDHADGAVDPPADASGTTRVFRGGSMVYGGKVARCSNRLTDKPTVTYPDLGFRCAKSLP